MFYFLFFFSKSKNAIDFVHTRVINLWEKSYFGSGRETTQI